MDPKLLYFEIKICLLYLKGDLKKKTVWDTKKIEITKHQWESKREWVRERESEWEERLIVKSLNRKQIKEEIVICTSGQRDWERREWTREEIESHVHSEQSRQQ